MKVFKKMILLILVLGLVATACKKDNKKTTEQPFKSLFADTSFGNPALNDTFIDQPYNEFGFEFTVTKNGNVTQLGTKNPDTGTIRVTLWDLSDTSIIAQKTITVIAHTAKYENLSSPIPLTTRKKYAITMHSNDYYSYRRTAFEIYFYPITKGNINITKYGFTPSTVSSLAIYPTVFRDGYLAGIADFTFETEN
jgi:hypothetical protein